MLTRLAGYSHTNKNRLLSIVVYYRTPYKMTAIVNLDYSHVGHIGHSAALNNNYDRSNR